MSPDIKPERMGAAIRGGAATRPARTDGPILTLPETKWAVPAQAFAMRMLSISCAWLCGSFGLTKAGLQTIS